MFLRIIDRTTILKCIYQDGFNVYSYDSLSQLIRENNHSYAFDSLQNRLVKDGTAHSINSLNQVIQEGETQYRYDLCGNRIEKITPQGSTSYSYDALNRLIRVQTPDQTISYAYDAFHRRLSKTVDNKTTLYFYHNKEEIGSANPEKEIRELRVINPQGASIVHEIEGQSYLPVHSFEGITVQLLDSQGNTVQNYSCTAFGEETLKNSPITPWRFSSKRSDPETGLVYYGERYYDPCLGRWLTQDPAGFIDGNNLYTFVHNNPLKYTDPDGRLAIAAYFFIIAWGGTELSFTYCTAQVLMVAIGASLIREGCSILSDYYNKTSCNQSAENSTNEEKYPGSPQELEKNPDWKETSHPKQKEKGHREFINEETGEKIRFDKGKPEEYGHKSSDHYHRYNPESISNEDLYLDSKGNPVPKNSAPSHLYPPDGVTWEFI